MATKAKQASGRPPLGPNRVRKNLSITLDPELGKIIDALSKRTKVPRSRVIEEMLRAGRDATIKKLLAEHASKAA